MLLPISPSLATTVELTFSGTVYSYSLSVDPALFPLPSGVEIGSSVTGSLTYDTTATYSAETEANGGVTYRFPSGATSSSVTIAGNTWRFDQEHSITVNDSWSIPSRQYLNGSDYFAFDNFQTDTVLGSGTSVSPDGYPAGIFVMALDESGRLLNSDQLVSSNDEVDLSDPVLSADSSAGTLISSSGYDITFDISDIEFSFDGVVQQPTPDPIPDEPVQTVSNVIAEYGEIGLERGNIETWRQQFDWSYSDQTLTFDVDIQLAGDAAQAYELISDGENAGKTYAQVWEEGIERIWSDGATIINGDNPAEVIYFNFNVDFVTEDPDHIITVADNFPFNANALNWPTDLLTNVGWTDDYHDEFAAHEFAHLLGLYDEYVGGATDPNLTPELMELLCDNGSGAWCNSIMGSLGREDGTAATPQARHYSALLDFTGFADDKFLLLAMAPSGYYDFTEGRVFIEESMEDLTIAPVPVPASVTFLALGLLSLGGWKRFVSRRAVA